MHFTLIAFLACFNVFAGGHTAIPGPAKDAVYKHPTASAPLPVPTEEELGNAEKYVQGFADGKYINREEAQKSMLELTKKVRHAVEPALDKGTKSGDAEVRFRSRAILTELRTKGEAPYAISECGSELDKDAKWGYYDLYWIPIRGERDKFKAVAMCIKLPPDPKTSFTLANDKATAFKHLADVEVKGVGQEIDLGTVTREQIMNLSVIAITPSGDKKPFFDQVHSETTFAATQPAPVAEWDR
ncbi:hypothetical protein K2X33_10935 [bacterium]|nr:hypothetical protein [bacterium]